MNCNKPFLIVLLVLFSVSVNATTVSSEDALHRALSFLSTNDKNATIEEFSISGRANMYKIITKDGWCLMSSNVGVKPILAYSTKDPFPSVDQMPDAMKWLFSYYEECIEYANEHADNIDINAWRENTSINSRDTVCLSRLGNNIWGQSENNIEGDASCNRIYNKFCPDFHSVSCERTLVGCGAVALGQVLWYHKWPQWGLIPEEMLNDTGLVSAEQQYKIYDWNMMPEGISLLTTIEESEMIASFLRDCGFAARMKYGTEGSATTHVKICNALNMHFDYLDAVWVNRNNFPTSWITMMKSNIRAGNPVIYCGNNGASGHAFVLYGYSNDYFNINWGWRGNSNNTLYALDALYVNGTHYNYNHYAVINIIPEYPSCSPLIIPSTDDLDANFVIQNGGSITIGNRTITSGMQGIFISGESIMLTSDFKVAQGAHVIFDVKDMYCDDRGDEIHSEENVPDYHYAPQQLISPPGTTSSAIKILRNGQIYILRGDKTYTIQGIEIKE